MGKYFIILGTQSLKGMGLFLFSLLNLGMCVESGFIQNGYSLYVFDLGFWGFGFALVVLVCLWAIWYNKSFMIKSLHNPFWFNMIQYLNWIPTF